MEKLLERFETNALDVEGLKHEKKRNDNSSELVDESVEERSPKIVQELLRWLREDAVSIPRV